MEIGANIFVEKFIVTTSVLIVGCMDVRSCVLKWPLCDAPFSGGPVDHHQSAENLCVSYHETHT